MLPESKLVISAFPGEERPITCRHTGEDQINKEGKTQGYYGAQREDSDDK